MRVETQDYVRHPVRHVLVNDMQAAALECDHSLSFLKKKMFKIVHNRKNRFTEKKLILNFSKKVMGFVGWQLSRKKMYSSKWIISSEFA